MPSIFSRIVAGEIPCYRIAEDDDFLAFLDVFPLVKGHTLVIPKLELDKLYELDDRLLGRMLVFASPLARAIEAAMPCQRVGMSVIGLEVPHAHLHLVPIKSADDLNFTRPKLSVSPEEMQAVQQAILSRL